MKRIKLGKFLISRTPNTTTPRKTDRIKQYTSNGSDLQGSFLQVSVHCPSEADACPTEL